MTANQIAAQSERELERHNVTVEEETERHNREMEDLQQLSLDITQSYNTYSLEQKEKLAKMELEYKYASDKRKYELEEEMNAIKQAQTLADVDYKNEMASIERQRYAADKAYKEAMAEIGYMGHDIENKRIEYQKHQWDEQNAITREQMQLTGQIALLESSARQYESSIRDYQAKSQQLKNERDYSIQLMQQGINYLEEMRKIAETSGQLDYMKSAEIKNYMETAMKPFSVIDFGVSP